MIGLDKFKDRPWIQRMFEGSIFNVENHHRFEVNEISVTREGGGYNRVDSWNPGGENVSRKNSQLGEIDHRTGQRYLDEFEAKYQSNRPDITIADTEGNRAKLESAGYDPNQIVGQRLTGDQVLEIPIQNGPPPVEILKDAASRRPPISIRDNAGTTWSVAGEKIVETRADGSQLLYPGKR